jgi:hypothetical protein
MGGKITLVQCQNREGGGQLDRDRRLDHIVDTDTGVKQNPGK